MISPSKFTWIVVAPGGVPSMALAMETSRAGAKGFLDLENTGDSESVRRALRAMGTGSGVPIGVKLDASVHVSDPVLAALPSHVSWVILSRPPRSSPVLRGIVSALQQKRLQVFVEAVSVAEAVMAQEAGADAIIAKGNEAGGRVGGETTFVFLQHLSGLISKPVYAHGGIGLHTAAGCLMAGAAGAVLDWQLSLVLESTLNRSLRDRVAKMDGTETVSVGQTLGEAYRLFLGPQRSLRQKLDQEERRIIQSPADSDDERIARWRAVVDEYLASRGDEALKVGQDVSFAPRLAAKFRTVSGVLDALDRSLRYHCSRVREVRPLAPGKGVAGLLGIRHPIVQGPMSRVSDTPAFAAAVADAGGLPVLAVAAMRTNELEPMLRGTRDRLGNKPWAIGLLGFITPELYSAQVELVKRYRPTAAVIAGGRPAQAQELEAEGIRAFIHAPSHRLLDLYIDEGIRDFIFEGLECGGHIGRYPSSVLWENAIEVLLDRMATTPQKGPYSVLFAGGISTALSAAIVSTLAVPLADRGVNVGVLVGTAYLFTREAVDCGAIQPQFQRLLLEARNTVVLDCGGGYEIRAAPSDFVKTFEEEKQRLIEQGLPADQVRMALENITLGRLRIAAKGVEFNRKSLEDPGLPETIPLTEAEQRSAGVYMAGQAITFHNEVCSLEELHRRITEEPNRILDASEHREHPVAAVAPTSRERSIAIIGMSAIFPGAKDLSRYWENILNKTYAIIEVPPERWDLRTYFDKDPKAPDKIYSRWGGFIDPVEFDPLKYGIPPKSVASIDPYQLMTLEVVDRALRDAGYHEREFDRKRTSVFVGEGGAVGNLGQLYCLRSLLPMFMENVPEEVLSQLPDWTEDSFPGLLPNVIAGRIANQYDLGGTNLSTSAACAAGLAALSLGIDELVSGKSRMSIVAAVDVQQNPFTYLCFAKTLALSPTGTPRCFDASGDGIVISQGIGAVILKRLEDAERDGDRIYAVIRGVGSSSDGRGKSLTAPTVEGQLQAMRRAYEQAGFDLDTLELIEAHGTGTVLGDRTEAQSIAQALRDADAPPKNCAVGTVKSMIGHTKGCAGMAGLIKIALATYHKVLPATLWVTKPAAEELWNGDSPAYLNTETRPWIGKDHPRRAAVSSFGFGGTNFHAVVEEHAQKGKESLHFPLANWAAELFCFSGSSLQDILAGLELVARSAEQSPPLCDLAYTAFTRSRDREGDRAENRMRVAVVADSLDDLREKLSATRARLAERAGPLSDPQGIYFSPDSVAGQGKIAFVFPGQGSQRVDMLRDLTIFFPEMRERFFLADQTLAGRLPRRLSQYIYPPPRFTEEEEKACMAALMSTEVAQPALGAAGLGVQKILRSLGIEPDMTAGHSSGEYVALCVAGVFPEQALYTLLAARGSCMVKACGEDAGTMMAIGGPRERLEEILRDLRGIYPANFNSPFQTVVSGRRADLEALARMLEGSDLQAQFIPVSCGFHSPFVSDAARSFEKELASVACAAPALPVYSNYLAAPFPSDSEQIRTVLSAHLSHPVRFMDEIRRMHEDGARVFIEAGPGSVCSKLISEILVGKQFAAVTCDSKAPRHGMIQLLHALGQLFAHGVRMQLEPMFSRRPVRRLLEDGVPGEKGPKRPQLTWMVSPEVSWPASEPRPLIRPVPAPTSSTRPARPVVAPPAVPQPERPRRAEHEVRMVREATTAIFPPPPAAMQQMAALSAGQASEVVLRYQKLMATFLEQQKEIMLTYLGGTTTSGVVASDIAAAQSAAPTKEAAASSRMETLTPAAVSASAGGEAGLALARNATTVTAAELQARLVALVSERTGYPTEMLDPKLDMEADLGIDSIKRVEILTTFGRELPELAAAASAQLRTARTLQDVIAIMAKNLPAGHTSAPAVEAAPPAPPSEPDMQRRLVELISERTGYPAEMLAPELDLEADLGIDSIKRVEILTAFAKEIPQLAPRASEELRRARTLRDVVRCIHGHTTSGGTISKPTSVPVPEEDADRPGEPLDRYVITLRNAPLAAGDHLRPPRGVLLITDDGTGIAAHLRERIRSLGGRAVLVRPEDSAAADEDGFAADFADPHQIESLIGRVRGVHGAIGGVIHLLPLRAASSVTEMSAAEWQRLVDQEVKGFFYLLRYAANDLKSSPGSWVISCLALGGRALDHGLPIPEHPWRGGLIGVVKTVAVEWPDAVAKCLALEPAPPDQLSQRILLEVGGPKDHLEVYCRSDERLVPEPVRAPFVYDDTRLQMDAEDVVVLIGGARGITSEIGRELAHRYRPTLILVGRSPWPGEESHPTAGLEAGADLKKVLFEHLRAQGRKPTPAELEKESRRILINREMRASRAAMEASGATVHYYETDARHLETMQALFRRIYETHGRIDGVVYGAGIIEDKLIEDKTPESFDHVFDTKSRAIFHLATLLKPEALKFLVIFSSIAGWTGNRGQVDYVAANEVLNRMALHLGARWKKRVVAIDWGPWEISGMVTEGVRRQFLERGVGLVSPQAGRRFVLDELRHGGHLDSIVLALGKSPLRETVAISASPVATASL